MRDQIHPVEPEEVMAYLDGELPIEQASRIAAHLGQCILCQGTVADLRQVSDSMTSWQIESFEPQMSPALEAALHKHDARASSASDSRRHPFNPLRRISPWAWGIPATGLAAVLILSVTHQEDRAVPFIAQEQRSTLAAQFSAKTAAPAPPPAVGMMADKPVAPMIARTADITLSTGDFDKTRTGLDQVLQHRQGYLGQLNVSSPTSGVRSLTATLRVPADQLAATLSDLKALGRVESESQNGEEVSQQYVDLEAHLQNARNTETRLTELLQHRTGELSDVLAVETEISRVRGEIETMEADKKLLEKRVAFATVNLTVNEEFKAHVQMVPNSLGNQFRNSAIDGYQTAVNGLFHFVLLLVAYGPTLLLWTAILFFPARFLWRRWKQRRA